MHVADNSKATRAKRARKEKAFDLLDKQMSSHEMGKKLGISFVAAAKYLNEMCEDGLIQRKKIKLTHYYVRFGHEFTEVKPKPRKIEPKKEIQSNPMLTKAW